jgi:hypothetical protein
VFELVFVRSVFCDYYSKFIFFSTVSNRIYPANDSDPNRNDEGEDCNPKRLRARRDRPMKHSICALALLGCAALGGYTADPKPEQAQEKRQGPLKDLPGKPCAQI